MVTPLLRSQNLVPVGPTRFSALLGCDNANGNPKWQLTVVVFVLGPLLVCSRYISFGEKFLHEVEGEQGLGEHQDLVPEAD